MTITEAELTLWEKRKKFLEETCSHFNSKNRGIMPVTGLKTTKCSYVAGCAIGRHIADKNLCAELDASTDGTGVSHRHVFDRLPKELQELGIDFLDKVQRLHDDRDNWDEQGLSNQGEVVRDNIGNIYA